MFSSKRTESREKQSFTKSGKYGKSMTSSFSKEAGVSKRRYEPRNRRPLPPMAPPPQPAPTSDAVMTSPIITLVVGADHRMFAAHEHILAASPYFAAILRSQADDGMVEGSNRKIYLPDEDPAILSSILEYLYKGDYYPRLVHNKRRNSWELEPLMDDGEGAIDSTIFHSPTEGALLKDTVIYCAAEKFGLEELKRIALRKQGLQSGIQCSTILASARYAYANTPDTDSKLRAHYLALIIRSRSTFKRSGTMQLEMYNGGTQLFFDLFVALCNHVDDISSTAQNTTDAS